MVITFTKEDYTAPTLALGATEADIVDVPRGPAGSLLRRTLWHLDRPRQAAAHEKQLIDSKALVAMTLPAAGVAQGQQGGGDAATFIMLTQD